MSTIGYICTALNLLCAAINSAWGIYWIKRLEKSNEIEQDNLDRWEKIYDRMHDERIDL